jgi:hypothetical protein
VAIIEMKEHIRLFQCFWLAAHSAAPPGLIAVIERLEAATVFITVTFQVKLKAVWWFAVYCYCHYVLN